MSKLVKIFRYLLRFQRNSFAALGNSKVSLDCADVNPKVLQAKQLFRQGKVDSAHAVLQQVQPLDGTAHLLLAEMSLAASCYQDAESHAFRCMIKSTVQSQVFKDAFYLRLESLRFMQKHAVTLHALQSIPFKESAGRYFRALRLALSSADEIQIYKTQLCNSRQDKGLNDHALHQYSILLRDFGFYDQAIEVARERFVDIISSREFGCKKKKKNESWIGDAKLALSDLKEDMERRGIQIFLISGTLLGCIREGGIIGHDKDIDVGFDEKYSVDQVKDAIRQSPRFRFLEIPFESNVYIQHANGVSIDLFRHYLQDGLYFHEGIKARWWNTPFELMEVDFLGGRYFIPSNHDVYLTENYGDWRIPNSDFETFVDTPNMEVTVKGQLLWYYMTKLSDYYLYGKKGQFDRVWQACSKLHPDISFSEQIMIPLLRRI